MFVINACGDGEAKSLFSESSIGDTDGDGAPEFLDAWGHPISFARWAPGFDSDIQANANLLNDPPPSQSNNTDWDAAAKASHDPFDLFRVDPDAFRLVPLIISAGRDESFGLRLLPGVSVPTPAPSTGTWLWRGISDPRVSYTLSKTVSNNYLFLLPRLTPYVRAVDPVGSVNVYLGADDGSKTATDNIHNHLIGTR
jgi:hypothetical protein